MKKVCAISFCWLLLCVAAAFVFPQDAEPSELPESPGLSNAESGETGLPPIVRGLIASGETLLSNTLVMTYNIIYSNVTGEGGWATPSSDSLYENFTVPWIWEKTDGFKVNQFGHPFQGSTYFSAGRVNGFGFYESAFFSALGSSTWESLFESNRASINDCITTLTGSMPMGEMLYRLYLAACAAGVPAPVAGIINPTAAIHRLITGLKPPVPDSSLSLLRFHLGTGFAQTHYSLTGSSLSNSASNSREMFAFRGFYADVGFAAIHGDPFDQSGVIPFEHFELAMSLGLDIGNYMNIRFISDGYLFSFTPVKTATDTMSTGLSLHMDFISMGKFDIYDGTIDQSSLALDWTIKYQHLFTPNTIFQTKFHAGGTFMGASNYYSPDREEELKNYGGGLNGKLFLALENRKLGKFEASLMGYALWTFPGTSAISQGVVYWLFASC